MYTQKVIDHFQNPRNMGAIKNADGVGTVGNIICGDMMKLYIKVSKEIIKDIKFETFGCAAAIASSSMITEMVKGKTWQDALKLTKNDVMEELGGLPPVKTHCSLLAIDALSEAIFDYLSKTSRKIPADLKKCHKRIEKERDLVEEKYGE